MKYQMRGSAITHCGCDMDRRHADVRVVSRAGVLEFEAHPVSSPENSLFWNWQDH